MKNAIHIGDQANTFSLPVYAGAPYPALMVEAPNRMYARMLQADLAGSRSETTCIMQYMYQHWILPAVPDNITETMRRIAQVEMHHWDILGQLIVMLGGNPALQAIQKRPVPWNGSMINYSRSPSLAMHYNLLLEQATIDAYRKQAATIQDAHLVAVLQRLILDEELHLRIFQQFLAACPVGNPG